jgi:hypothetical protein
MPVGLQPISFELEVTLWPTFSRPVNLGVKPHLGPKTRFLLLSDCCGFVNVGRPLWWEDECHLPQSMSVVHVTHIYNLHVGILHSQAIIKIPVPCWYILFKVLCVTLVYVYVQYMQDGRLFKLLMAFASTVIPGFSLLEIHDQDFYSLLYMYMFRNWASSSTKEVSVFLCKRYVCCIVVSAQVYPRCHGVQVTMNSVHPLSLHCTKSHLCKIYRGFRSMQACAAGCALSYLTTLNFS